MISNFNFYPYTSPLVMDDDVFQKYGGLLVNTTNEQRQASYVIAEQTLSEDLDTYLAPTNVTGSYALNENKLLNPFLLDHAYVNQVNFVRFHDFKEDVYYTVSGTANWYLGLRDAKYGIIDVNYYLSNCRCAGRHSIYPYQLEVAYNTGLPTGTASSSNILLALTLYSSIILNEILGYGNEAPGDVGVKNYQNQSYRESRIALLRTNYGTSAKAQFIDRLIRPYKVLRNSGW